MLIQNIHIKRFGIFSEQSMSGLSRGLNVFLGQNEAGKSTLLKFFRTMFFGYSRGKKNFDYSGASGAKAGGQLDLLTQDKQKLHLLRRPLRKGQDFMLTGSDGRNFDESFWSGLFSGYTSELYNTVFTFDLQDIAKLESLQGANVTAALYGAAFGTGFRSPALVLDELRKKRIELFTPDAKIRPINALLFEQGEIRSRLLELGSELEQHAAFSDELERLKSELILLEQGLAGIKAELALAKAHFSAWETWEDLQRIELELSLSPAPGGSFAPGCIERLATLQESIQERKAFIAARSAELERLQVTSTLDLRTSRLAEILPDCQRLHGRRAALLGAGRQLHELTTEVNRLEVKQAEAIALLGVNWSLEQIEQFNLSIEDSARFEAFEQSLAGAVREEEQATQLLEEYAGLLAVAEQNEQRLRSARGMELESSTVMSNRDYLGAEQRFALEQAGKQLETAQNQYNMSEAAVGRVVLAITELRQEQELLQDKRQKLEHELTPADMLEQTRQEFILFRQKYAEFRAGCLAAGVVPTAGKIVPAQGKISDLIAAVTSSVTGVLFLVFGINWSMWLEALGTSAALPDFIQANWIPLCAGMIFLSFSGYALGKWQGLFKNSQERLLLTGLQQAALELAARGKQIINLPFFSDLNTHLEPEASENFEILAESLANFDTLFETKKLVLLNHANLKEQEEVLQGKVQKLESEHSAGLQQLEQAACILESSQLAWEKILQPFGLSVTCNLDAALQIFDRSLATFERRIQRDKAEERKKAAEQSYRELKENWAKWLAGKRLDQHDTPAAARIALSTIKEIQKVQEELTRNRLKLATAKAEIIESQQEAQRLSDFINGESLVKNISAEPAELVAVFDQLFTEAQEAGKKYTFSIEQLKRIEDLRLELEEARARLQQDIEAVEKLLEQGAADSIEAYYTLQLQFEQYQSLHQQRKLALLRLEQVARNISTELQNSAEPLASFMTGFTSTSLEHLTAQIETLLTEIAIAEQRQKEIHIRQGELQNSLAELLNGETTTALKRQEAELAEKLQSLARRWSVLALARTFINQAKQRFELERQDNVIRQAGDLFCAMTQGSYQGLSFEIKDKISALALPKVGEPLDSELALSQGTKEQLYLAMRLAFIQHHNQSRESLPIVMDDILVNFDPDRAAATAALLASFSDKNQILFFTCHPHIAELLCAAAPHANMFKVDKGKISQYCYS